MNVVNLSGVVITFNEEEKIGRCIQSLLKVCEEVLILDSFSNDRTCVIAEGMGARVLQNKFEGHVQQKNKAKDLAQNHFILSLDADEELSEELIHSIINVKNNWTADAYRMNRLNNYGGQWIKHGAWYPDKKLRLWDRRAGNWGGDNPHDRFILNKGCSVSNLKGDLLHYTVDGIEDLKKQTENFSSIAAQTMYDKHLKTNWLKWNLKSLFRFIKEYVFLLGFLDGKAGLDIALMNARYVALKNAKLFALNKKKPI